MIVKLDMAQYVEHQKALAEKFQPAIARGLRSGVARCLAYVQQKTREATPANPAGVGSGGAVDTGEFLRSWGTSCDEDSAAIFNRAPYAGVVEGGRRPGARQPPSKPLAKWAQRRLGLSEKEAAGVGFVIARAIGKRGLKGRHILDGAKLQMTKFIHQEIRRELQAVIAGRTP